VIRGEMARLPRAVAVGFGLALLVASPALATGGASPIGDAERGATFYDRQCKVCHQIGPDAVNRIGPPLNGIYGRRAGIYPDFKYSKSMVRMGNDGLTWTLETLDAYVENPKALVSGTRMNYRGLKDAEARAALLAFLRDWSDKPADIPEAEPTAVALLPVLPPEVLALEGDREYGEYLSSECLTCHKRDGADEGIPSITGWPEEDFVVAMHAYKEKLRPHPVMQMMAGRLSNEEIAALAAYFATLE
jgi:cytochrome c